MRDHLLWRHPPVITHWRWLTRVGVVWPRLFFLLQEQETKKKMVDLKETWKQQWTFEEILESVISFVRRFFFNLEGRFRRENGDSCNSMLRGRQLAQGKERWKFILLSSVVCFQERDEQFGKPCLSRELSIALDRWLVTYASIVWFAVCNCYPKRSLKPSYFSDNV